MQGITVVSTANLDANIEKSSKFYEQSPNKIL